MSRPLRLEAPGEFFHVLSRGNARAPLFLDDDDNKTFLDVLTEVVERFDVACHAYCLMGNHYHLLVQPRRGDLSGAVRHLNGVYAQRLNRRWNRTGHAFEGRFKSLLVDRDSYAVELARYIVLNPVRAALVSKPEDWPWSSYRAMLGLTPARALLTTEFLLALFDVNDLHNARATFREFVGRGMVERGTAQRCRKAIRAGGIVGGRAFVSRFSRLAAGAPRGSRDPSSRYSRPPPPPVGVAGRSRRRRQTGRSHAHRFRAAWVYDPRDRGSVRRPSGYGVSSDPSGAGGVGARRGGEDRL